MTPTDDILRYLRQQQQMYGNVLYFEPGMEMEVHAEEVPAAEPSPVVTEQETTIDQTMPVQPKPSVRSVSSAPLPATLDELYDAIHTCTKCPLGFTRNKFVFGSGSPTADLMVIGEAPGADEDAQGFPFVGRAGQLLTKILESIGLSRQDDVYICNILKCRPPNNRKPLVTETDECEPYLLEQIRIVKPKFILALGLTAANTLLKNKDSMGSLRGKVHDYHGINMLVTYHPAALLRNPEWKKLTWEDVKLLKSLMSAA